MRLRILAAAAVLVVAACTTSQRSLPTSDPSRTAWPDGSVDALKTPATLVSWTAYRTFYFDTSTADISTLDMPKAYEIVAYLKDNPSFDVGIDCTRDLSETGRTLDCRRAASVRQVLMDAGAGVASYKIFTGAFADPSLRRPGQVQVFVRPRTGSLKAAL